MPGGRMQSHRTRGRQKAPTGHNRCRGARRASRALLAAGLELTCPSSSEQIINVTERILRNSDKERRRLLFDDSIAWQRPYTPISIAPDI